MLLFDHEELGVTPPPPSGCDDAELPASNSPSPLTMLGVQFSILTDGGWCVAALYMVKQEQIRPYFVALILSGTSKEGGGWGKGKL